MIEVESGGTTVEFPDGTPPEVIKKVMSEQFGKRRQAGRQTVPNPKFFGEEPPMAGRPEPTVGDQLKAGVRPAVIATAATAGGALGMPAGPAGMLGGATLGAAGGSLLFDSLNDALNALGIEELPGGTPRQDTELGNLGARSQTALQEGTTEAAFTGGFSLLFPVKRFLAPLFGKVMGVRNEAAQQMRKLAASQGIELAAVDIGGPVAKGFAKVLGVFPFTGSPLRSATVRRDRAFGIVPFTGKKEQIGMVAKEAKLNARIDGILNEVAPTSTLAGEVGVDLAKAATQADLRFRSASAQLYDAFRESARGLTDEAGNIVPVIPTAEAKTAIARFVEESRLGEIPLGGDVQVLKGGVPENFEQFLKDAQNLPSHLTYDQYVRLQQQFEGFIDKVSPDPFTVKRVAQIKQAMEADLNAIGSGVEGVSQDALQAVKKLKEDADTFFANGILVFQTPTAAKFGRVNKNIFRAGPDKAGTINPDELMTPVFNVKSPQALRDLRGLVGDEAFKRAARAHLDDVVANSFKTETRGGKPTEVFDLDTFQAQLGLVPGKKDKSEAVAEMFKGTGVSVQDLKDLIENARIAKITDPSTFVARRVTLGGAGALVGALGVGAAGPPGVLTPVALTLLARHSSKILADPKKLKALTASFSPTLDEVQKRALLLRLARQLGEANPTSEGPTVP